MIRIDDRTVEFTVDEAKAYRVYDRRLDKGDTIRMAVEATRKRAQYKGWLCDASFWEFISQ